MSLQYCRGYNISTNFCSVHASYRKQQETFETAQRSAATIMTSMFPFCVLHHIFSSCFIILLTPTCTNIVSTPSHTCCSSSMTLLANSNTSSFCCTTAAIITHSQVSTPHTKKNGLECERTVSFTEVQLDRKSGSQNESEYQCLCFLGHQCSWVLLFSKQNKPRQILSWVVLPASIAFTTVEGKIKKLSLKNCYFGNVKL